MVVDEFDVRILTEIQRGDTTAAALALRVKLSTSAVTKRLSRLRRVGLIARTVAVLDLARIGPSVAGLVLLALDPDGPLTRDEFVALVQSKPEITNVLLLGGDYGIALVIRTRTLEHYTAAVRALQVDFPRIRSVRDQIVLSELKRSLAVALSLIGLDLTYRTCAQDN